MHGGILGLRGNTLRFPLTAKVLTQYAKQWIGDMPFTSVALLANLATPLHSDRNNAKGFDNFLIGVSQFKDGGLWLENPQGPSPAPAPHSHLSGDVLPVSGQCIYFDAHLRHATMPWSGRRVVLAGFVIKGYEAISASDHDKLLELGFNPPDLSTGDLVRHGDLAAVERPIFVAPQVPVVFELFAGTGRVTACLRKLGLKSSHGIDHVVTEHASSIPLIADLTTEEGQQRAMFWITNPLLSAVFAAPPCGTCSRAREIPVPGSHPRSGPQPLRSAEYPDGLPNLSGDDLQRVISANRTYEFLAKVATLCHSRGVLFACENPHRSWFWHTSFFREVSHLCPFRVTFDHCAFGGQRPKRTTIASSTNCFRALERNCPGESASHTHLPWGTNSSGFATKEETAYPPPLAAQVATAIARHLVDCEWSPPEALPQPHSLLTACRAAVNEQPKSSKFPALVPEHCAVVLVKGPRSVLSALPCAPMARIKCPWPVPAACSCKLSVIPAEAQLLRTTPLSVNKGTTPSALAPKFEDADLCEVAWGIPHSPQAFVASAAKAGHPKTLRTPLPEPLRKAVDLNKKLGPEGLASFREDWFRKWEARATQLEEEEAKLKASMPEHLRSILAPKRLVLWREIMEDLGYKDVAVFNEVVEGTNLLGQVPLTGLYPQTFKPAKASPSEVLNGAEASRKRTLDSVRSQGSVDDEVKKKSMEEHQAGWLQGPYSADDLESAALVSRRFGLLQGTGEEAKVRLIDDMSASTVNSAVQVCESPQPHSIDVLGCLLLECLEKFPRDHFVGRSYDLKAAYRQLGLSEESLQHAYIAFYDSDQGTPAIHRLTALPFGSIRSVHSFLRVSHSLWHIGCSLGLLWTCYFDDFPVVTSKALEASTTQTVTRLFNLLGWTYASEGKKAEPFSPSFSCLGVSFNLQHFTSGRIEVSNTPSRTQELLRQIDEALESETLPTKAAQSLRGRLQFADSQIFGRSGKLCLKALDDHVQANAFNLSQDSCNALRRYRQILEHGRPRTIGRPSHEVLYLFTDAAYEAGRCGIGGILYDARTCPVAFFSYFLTDTQSASLGALEKKTIIFEAELIAYVAAIVLWRDRVLNRSLVAFIDNNSVRDVCISGKARNQTGRKLVSLLLAVEDMAGLNVWISRVPSPSNPSDILSRELTTVWGHGSKQIKASQVGRLINEILE